MTAIEKHELPTRAPDVFFHKKMMAVWHEEDHHVAVVNLKDGEVILVAITTDHCSRATFYRMAEDSIVSSLFERSAKPYGI